MVYRAAYRKQNILGLDSQSRVCHNQMKPKIQDENPLSQTLTCYHLCTFSAFFPLIISQYQSMEEILGRILRKKKVYINYALFTWGTGRDFHKKYPHYLYPPYQVL